MANRQQRRNKQHNKKPHNPGGNNPVPKQVTLNRVKTLKRDVKVPAMKVSFDGTVYEIVGGPTLGFLDGLASLNIENGEQPDNAQTMDLIQAFYQYQLPPELAEVLAHEDISVLENLFELWKDHLEAAGVELGEY